MHEPLQTNQMVWYISLSIYIYYNITVSESELYCHTNCALATFTKFSTEIMEEIMEQSPLCFFSPFPDSMRMSMSTCQNVFLQLCHPLNSSSNMRRSLNGNNKQVKMKAKVCCWDYNVYNIINMLTAAHTSLHHIKMSCSTIRMLFLPLLTPNTNSMAICLPVLAFMVAGLLWLLPFMAEIPMPYSVAGRRSDVQKQEDNKQELRGKVMH